MQFKSFEECVYSFTHFLYTGSILKSISIPEPLKITQTILMFIQCRHFLWKTTERLDELSLQIHWVLSIWIIKTVVFVQYE